MIWLALVIHVTMYNAIWCLQVKITSPLAKYAINSTAVVRGEITEIIRLGHTFVWNFKNVRYLFYKKTLNCKLQSLQIFFFWKKLSISQQMCF